MNDLGNLQILMVAIVLALLWALETVIPFSPNSPGRIRHIALNIALGLFNSILLALLFVPILFLVTTWVQENKIGILYIASLPLWLSIVIAILLQDAWMYLWHRINHRVPFLWRFHRVHHSDREMDASTAVRFHPGEIIISAVLRLGVITILGLSLWQVLLYDVLLLPVILLHHSNIQFPEKIDRVYRVLFASPAMHRIHHSQERIETDSNYGTIFSFWDRLARSFRLREGNVPVKYGLYEIGQATSEQLWALAKLPFHVLSEGKDQAQTVSGSFVTK